MTAAQSRVAITASTQISENPLWSACPRKVCWMDVESRQVQRWFAGDDSVRRRDVAEPVGCIGLRASGGLVGVCRSGFNFPNETSGAICIDSMRVCRVTACNKDCAAPTVWPGVSTTA